MGPAGQERAMSDFEKAAKAMRDTCLRAAAEMGMSVSEALAIFREHPAPTDDAGVLTRV